MTIVSRKVKLEPQVFATGQAAIALPHVDASAKQSLPRPLHVIAGVAAVAEMDAKIFVVRRVGLGQI